YVRSLRIIQNQLVLAREIDDRIDDGVVRAPANAEEQETIGLFRGSIRPRPIVRLGKPEEQFFRHGGDGGAWLERAVVAEVVIRLKESLRLVGVVDNGRLPENQRHAHAETLPLRRPRHQRARSQQWRTAD